MSDAVKIVDLPSDSAIGGGEEFPVTDAGTTKKISTGALKDWVIAQLMASGAVSSVTDSYIVLRDSSGEAKRISVADFNTALAATFATLGTAQTISGAKTFSEAVTVPAPSANGHAATKKYVDDGLANKVSKETGKGLSKNDFTDALLAKLNGIAAGAQVNAVTSVNNKTGAVVLSASDVGAAVQTPTFAEAETLTGLVGSGETSETLWGKVKKAIASLISHIADTTAHVTSADRTAWGGALASSAKVTAFGLTPSDANVPSEKLVKDSLDAKLDTSAKVTAFGLMPSDDKVPSEKLVKDSLAGKVDTDIIVTSFGAPPSDSKVPSEKLVKDALDGKQATLTFDNSPTSGSNNPVKSGGIYTALAGKQAANLVTSFQSTPDDTHYPSEKLVKDSLDGKQATLVKGTNLDATPTENSDNPVTSGGVFEAIANGGMTIDSTPTNGSTNPVQSGGVYTALQGKQNTLSFDQAPTAASSNPVTSGGIKGALDAKMNSDVLVTSWGASPSHMKVPSAKLVKDTIDGLNFAPPAAAGTKTFGSSDPMVNVEGNDSAWYVCMDNRGQAYEQSITLRSTFKANSVQTLEMFLAASYGGSYTFTTSGNDDHTSNSRTSLYINGIAAATARELPLTTGKLYHIVAKFVNGDSNTTIIIHATES